MQYVNTKSQMAGRTMKRKVHKGTLVTWSKMQPGYHDRTMMLKRCGKKCFLGPNKSFPICSRRTCKPNRKGIYAAYIRAREYMTIKPGKSKYRRISTKAHKLLGKVIREP